MKQSKRPNFIIFISDHLTQRVLGAYGNTEGVTPNIDALAKNGVSFQNVYTTCPLCAPSRASFWTGRFPHETGVMSNKLGMMSAQIPNNLETIGKVFKSAGYETVHFGKTHDRGGLAGFKIKPQRSRGVAGCESWPVKSETTRDRYTREHAVKFLSKKKAGKKEGKKPFLMVVDYANPHNICSWVGINKGEPSNQRLPSTDEFQNIATDAPWDPKLPSLPDNFETTDLEQRPRAIQYMCCSHRRLSQASHWNEDNYRHYLAAYYHYTSRVDTEIGRVIDAFKKSQPQEVVDNTYILVFADHGDGIASHRMVTKHDFFYEETTRVPFIISGNPVSPKQKVLTEPIVSLLDLFPTLCGLADIPIPAGVSPYSLKVLIKESDSQTPKQDNSPSRAFAVSEWHTEHGFTVVPARMVRTRRFKYVIYLEDGAEELYDLELDPGETHNLAFNMQHNTQDAFITDTLKHHRDLLHKHITETNDPFFSMQVKAEGQFRSHPIGYHNHAGLSAPEYYGQKD